MALVKTTTYGAESDILIAPHLAFQLGCVIDNTGVDAGPDGRKIIKAGTPLYNKTASKNLFLDRNEPLTVQDTNKNLFGFARWDIDVTDNEKTNGTVLVDGYIDYLKLDKSVQTKIDGLGSIDSLVDHTHVLFIKGRVD